MEKRPDFRRLEEAIDEAVLALPATACEGDDAALRRACHEVVLLLRQTKERVLHLRGLFAAQGPRGRD
ncbi:MAG TPA: hypothetical protein VJ743_23085 [Albitalea sp.]|nr:hypothetical protein [Albitalea sp.]